MPRRAAEAFAVAVVAAVLTAAIALPVLREPGSRVFGMDIVGRHHDPFTMMEQFASPTRSILRGSVQPLTDVEGAALARLAGPVAAYNWLVLISFPLAATAAYLLARYLALSPAAAVAAALAYAFAPFHLAQAAYHPQVAQTQWMPLYLLALWRCLDDATPVRVALLAAAIVALSLSNLYGGAIAAVITPVAIIAHWAANGADRHATRRAVVVAGTLAVIAAAGAAYLRHGAPAAIAHYRAFAFPRADLFLYSAKWWSYLLPPVAHPWFGGAVRRTWEAAGVREGLLEQQVSLGAGVVILAAVGIARWTAPDRGREALARVPMLVAIAFAALFCSLSPERTIGAVTVYRPSALLYRVAPMFRSYARFGAVVQLMAALLAGIGIDVLRRSHTRWPRVACALIVVLAAGEYAVSPFSLWRDTLPTRAHRWVMRQPDRLRVLDCAPLTQESSSVPWLTGSRVTLLDGAAGDCGEPNLAQRLAAEGYTHLLVRRDNREGRTFLNRPAPPGLRLAASFRDAQIFAVAAAAPPIYTAAMTRFWPREHDGARSWRWMGGDAAWTVVNTEGRPIVATLVVELSAFSQPRRMDLAFDGQTVQTLAVVPERRSYEAGPFTVPPGRHELGFHPIEPPSRAGDGASGTDPRRLSYAVGTWAWTVRGQWP
jgi:hypothetical protein